MADWHPDQKFNYLKTIQLPYGKSHIDFSLSEERLAGILAPTKYLTVVDQWESQIQVRILPKYFVIVGTKAPVKMVKTFRMHHAKTVDEAIVKAGELLNNHKTKITVFPDVISVIIN